MRLLEQKKIPYRSHDYSSTGALSGTEVAAALSENPEKVFKTLVTVGKSKAYHVFVIPVGCELDLKKAAKAAGEKSIEMIKQKELLPLTGYIHGGCSPIGMKKKFPTLIDETAILFDEIYINAGMRGMMIAIEPNALVEFVEATLADLVKN